MRRSFIIALGTAVALATAAVAMAAFTAAGVSTTTATFAAAKVDSKTRACTGADGKAFEITNGHYTGTADFTNPATDLDGPLTIHARTTYSTTDSLGYVEGSFRVKDDDSRVNGKFWGTLDGSGNLVGFLEGQARGHHAVVLGNLSAAFGPGTTGFVGGKLGTGSSTAVLAVIAGRPCKAPKPDKPAKPAKPVSVKGEVTALGTAAPLTITVTSKGPSTTTCTLDATSPATFPTGTKVEMKCELVGTTWMLRELKKHK
jgi:hypothetical protein